MRARPPSALDRRGDVVLAVGPGKDRRRRRRRSTCQPPAARDGDLALLDHRIGEQALAHRRGLGAGRVGSSSASSAKRTTLPTRTSLTPTKPSAGSARSIVRPCGSAMPVKAARSRRGSRTSPACAPDAPPLGERPSGDRLVGLDVANAGGLDDRWWNRRRRRTPCPTPSTPPSRAPAACRRRAARRRASRRRPARSGWSRG